MRAKRYRKSTLLGLTAAVMAGQAAAETEMAEVLVTATRTEKDLSSAPGSFSVVGKKEIASRNIKSLDEALNSTVGVFNDSKGKGLMGTTTSVAMRGLSSDKRALFLLDGITPLNEAYTGAVSYQLQSVENIERIEVVKGPFSSLYGGNAMAGVVNVITRMPEKRELTVKTGYGSSFERGEGLDDLSKVYLSYGDRLNDRLSLLASYGAKAANGYATALNVQTENPADEGLRGAIPTASTSGAKRYLIGDSGDNTWEDDQLALKAKYDFSRDTKLNLGFMRSTYDYAYDEPHTYLLDAAGKPVWSYGTVKESSFLSGNGGMEQNIWSSGLETKLNGISTKLALSYLDVTDNWYVTRGSLASTTRSGGPGTVSSTPSANFNSDLQFDIPLFDMHLLTVGGAYRSGEADTEEHKLSSWRNEESKTALSYAAGGKDNSYALFAQDEILLNDSLTAYLGLRHDWWETSDGYANSVGDLGYPKQYGSQEESSLSPKAALVYQPLPETTLRVSAGQAFRAPTTYDLYRTWVSSTGVTYAANPALKPETVTSYDGGIEQGLWAGMKVKATYFHNEMEDMIYRQTVSSTLQEFTNAGKARTQGAELEAEQKFSSGVRLFANYTYTDSEMLENSAKPSTVGKKLPHVPENMFNAGIGYENACWSASLLGRYVSKRYGSDENSDTAEGVYGAFDEYFIADAKASWKLTQNAELSLAVDNLLDEEYFGYYKGTGRSWFAELTLRF